MTHTLPWKLEIQELWVIKGHFTFFNDLNRLFFLSGLCRLFLVPLSLISNLLTVQSDAQPQFGHAVLLQELQVRTQRQTEGPGDALRQPALLRRVAGSSSGILALLEEEDLKVHTVRLKVCELQMDLFINQTILLSSE